MSAGSPSTNGLDEAINYVAWRLWKAERGELSEADLKMLSEPWFHGDRAIMASWWRFNLGLMLERRERGDVVNKDRALADMVAPFHGPKSN